MASWSLEAIPCQGPVLKYMHEMYSVHKVCCFYFLFFIGQLKKPFYSYFYIQLKEKNDYSTNQMCFHFHFFFHYWQQFPNHLLWLHACIYRLLTFPNISRLSILPQAAMIWNLSEFCFSVLTPYYKEDVLYSNEELNKENEDGISILFYLKKIYPGEFYFYLLTFLLPFSTCALILLPDIMHLDEWTNFHERMEEIKDSYPEEAEDELIRQWASYRGQTLFRTGLYHNEYNFCS